jgi:hypothetical protein
VKCSHCSGVVKETVQNVGVLRSAWWGNRGRDEVAGHDRGDRGGWAVHVHEIGGAAVDEYSPGTVGLTLGGKARARWIAAPSRSGTDGGSLLLPPAAMPAMRGAAAHQGQAVSVSFVFVRYRECFRASIRSMPLRCDPPPDPKRLTRNDTGIFYQVISMR